MRSTSSAASSSWSQSRAFPSEPLPATFTEMAEAEPPRIVQDVMSGYLRHGPTLGQRTGGGAPRARQRLQRSRLRARDVHRGRSLLRDRRCGRSRAPGVRDAGDHVVRRAARTHRRRRRSGAPAARRTRTGPRADSRRAHARVQRVQDPRSRRLSPRPGALGRRRLLHSRLRGRTGPIDRPAPREAVAAQGCGRHAPLVQLRPPTPGSSRMS
jgi:hypothetical protein